MLSLLILLISCKSPETTPKDSDGDGATVATDCDDGAAGRYPGAPEVCDGIDQDCDGEIDENPSNGGLYFEDSDGDGYGNPALTQRACLQPEGYENNANDCNDADATIYPEATEHCDGLDQDCDTIIDEDAAEQITSYPDLDRDGYGANTAYIACTTPDGYVSISGDCDDSRSTISPAGTEICDNFDLDENCNGFSDDTDPTVLDASRNTYHEDLDGDGYGGAGFRACDPPANSQTNADDCDDSRADINPAIPEICGDQLDNDCDSSTPDGC